MANFIVVRGVLFIVFNHFVKKIKACLYENNVVLKYYKYIFVFFKLLFSFSEFSKIYSLAKYISNF